MCDFSVQHHGSIVILTPTSNAAHEWLKANVDLHQAIRWGQCSLVIELRYVDPIIDVICNEGLSIS
jgi:hypothetical protein